MDFSALLIKMIIFTILLAIGYGAARKGVLSREFAKSASWLLINVFLVASIVNAVLGARPDITKGELWLSLLIVIVMMVIIYAIATLCMKFDRSDEAPLTLILMAALNNLFIGIPVVQALSGSEAVFYIGLTNIPYNIFLYSYGAWYLKKGRGEKGINLRNIISPSLLAAVVSFIIFVFDIRVPRLVTELFSTVSSATVPLSMIVIGATLGPVRLKDAFSKPKLFLLSFIRLIVTPLLIFFLFRPFVSNEVLLLAIVVTAACPSGAVNTPLSIQYGYDPTYPSEMIMVSTVLSMVTLPLLLYALF